MNTQRVQVFNEVQLALKAGRPVFLVTVLQTWGASPRPAGSVLAFDPLKNKVYGSVSGGCVEESLLEHLRQPTTFDATTGYPLLAEYGADATGHALPCGASLELLIEYFDPVDAMSGHISSLINALSNQVNVCRKVRLDRHEPLLSETPPKDMHGQVWNDGEHVWLRCSSTDKLLLIGASDVALFLAPLASQIGYQVSICEPRASFLERQKLPEDLLSYCDLITDILPDDLVLSEYSDAQSAVVALAHDPRIDDLALHAALQGKAHFVGAMGSERNAVVRRGRLQELGISSSELTRLISPVGVSIGSRTPQEIAISIAAQLIAVRGEFGHDSIQSVISGDSQNAVDKQGI